MLPGLVIAFASALCWASVDVLRKVLAMRLPLLGLAVWLNLGSFPVFIAWMWWAGTPMPLAGYYLPAAASVACILVTQLLFLTALRISGLSATIPMLSLSPAATAIIAWFALAEAPTPRQALGLTAIVLGSLLNGVAGSQRLRFDLGALSMGAAAMLIAATGVWDKLALRYAEVPTHGAVLTFGSIAGLGTWLALRGRLGDLAVPPSLRRHLAAAAALIGLAYTLQLFAVQEVLVALVEGIKRGVGMPAAVLSGWWLLGEAVPPARLGAIAIIALGMWLLV